MPLAPNLATLVAVGNGHLLEHIFPYLGCCDQVNLFSMARFIHIEARPVLLREPWIAFHCAVCSEVKRRFYHRCIRRAPKAFGEQRQAAQVGRQQTFDRGLDRARENGRRAARGNGDGDGIAFDDGRGDEIGKFGAVDHIDRHTRLAGGGGDRAILGVVTRCGISQDCAVQVGGIEPARLPIDLAQFVEVEDFIERVLGNDGDPGVRLQQQTQLRRRRFAAARAYAGIVERRINECDEQRLGSYQRYSNFLMKTLQPAMRTCDAAERRTHEVAERVARAAGLLGSMVDMVQKKQNQAILETMAERATLQLRLQQAVEGFSIFAISYYAVGLIAYGLKSAKALGSPVDPEVATGFAAPAVFALVWFSVRTVRRRLHRDA